MTDPTRYFFVHLHKTAGTTLWSRFSRHFSAEQIFPGDDDGPAETRTFSIDALRERWPQRRADTRMLAAHYPYCTAELLGEEFEMLTLLRDPIDRVASALREQRQKLPEFANSTFEEIYANESRQLLIRNHMVKMFGMTPDEMTNGMLTPVDFDRSHLERACDNLEHVHHIGFQHDVEGFCERLSDRLGWELGEPVRANESRAEELSAGLLERIAEDNALDIEFYGFARDAFGGSPAAPVADTA